MIELLCKRTGASIRTVCQTMELPRSSYYHATTETPSQKADRNIGLAIQRIFKLHRSRYGHRRIWRELRDEGIVCSPSRVSRLIAERGLRAIQPRTFVPRTSDGRADKPADNLVKDVPKVERNDQIWVGDITFIPTSSGWSYLAIVMDLYSRRIVSWSLTNHLRASLVVDAFQQAAAYPYRCKSLLLPEGLTVCCFISGHRQNGLYLNNKTFPLYLLCVL